MKIATWNVNSLRVRLSQVLDWLAENPVDILGLQETKLPDEGFPVDEFAEAGYLSLYSGQRTYNGVALLARGHGQDVVTELPGLNDPQRRVMAATYGDLRVLNLYVPNGQSVGSEKYEYKLAWLNTLHGFLKEELQRHDKLAVFGDFNIAPEPEDVHDPDAWEGRVLFSEPERTALKRLLELGLTDVFRKFDQAEKTYSWWDYRMLGFQRNRGLRIDLILTTDALTKRCVTSSIDKTPRKWKRPSDHAPVIAEFDEP
ncbi:MAG: exodeoxyribonuclease III [Gammaproteobacteria bacterium]